MGGFRPLIRVDCLIDYPQEIKEENSATIFILKSMINSNANCLNVVFVTMKKH